MNRLLPLTTASRALRSTRTMTTTTTITTTETTTTTTMATTETKNRKFPNSANNRTKKPSSANLSWATTLVNTTILTREDVNSSPRFSPNWNQLPERSPADLLP